MKKVSVILPCYNVEKYIEETMECILKQSFPLDELEIIAVENGSTDGTLSVLQSYEKKYPELIMLVIIEKNQMAGYARNTGLTYATAPYVLFVDSDDWLFENAIEEAYRKAIEFDADVLEFDCMVGTERDTLKRRGFLNTENVQLYELDSDLKRRAFYAVGPKSGFPFTKLFKTDFLRKNQLCFAEHLRYEDTIFILLMILCVERYVIYDKCLYGYRINDSGISFGCRKNDYGQFDRMKVQMLMVEECERRNLLEKYYDIIEANFMRVGYAETFLPVVQRFEYLPDELKMIAKMAKSFFPNYKDNYYLGMPQNQWVMLVLKTLDEEVTEDNFRKWKKQFAG